MTPERWRQVKELMEAAWERNAEERCSFLDQACADDRALRREVEALLASDLNASEFLAVPAVELVQGQVPLESLESPAMPPDDPIQQPFGLTPAGRPAFENRGRRSDAEAMRGPETKSDGGSYMIGRRIGHYAITGLIGAGGMGIVYEAQDERLHRVVALKTLRESSLDPAGRQRLLREARVAAGINHPCVCQTYDIGEHEGQLYLAMERLEGESLAERVSRGPIIVAEAIQIALGILAGLEVLHRKHLIHRDLKPANVFLTPHGTKLLDFGLSRATYAPAAPLKEGTFGPVTETGMIIGTPNYMAPEQLVGAEVDEEGRPVCGGRPSL